ncbi:MAG TPA: anhydro-N-acetylmuramic acid kinase, partial [Trueperaceae bacterium]|nr:anhydro-N-acetylmuramic acid kinase [Trueperaceae bacterium]
VARAARGARAARALAVPPVAGLATDVSEAASAARDLPPLVVLGVMSGTSLDGVDTVTVRLERRDGRLVWDVLDRSATPYPTELRERLKASIDPARSGIVLITELHQQVGQVYAEVVAAAQRAAAQNAAAKNAGVQKAAPQNAAAQNAGVQPGAALGSSQTGHEGTIDLVALSGQTIFHIPRPDAERGWGVKSTFQIGEPAVVTERCRVTTVSEFRQSDIAAGGQGAPLVSFSDHLLYSEPGVGRAVLNLGGIANFTYLPADGDSAGVVAFDTGPASCIIDEAMQRFLGEERDDGGRVAAAGSVDAAGLQRLLDDPYFSLVIPKTTGREVFYLDAALARGWPSGDLPATPDLIASLTALTALSVAGAAAVELVPLGLDEVLVAGGGARNDELMRLLRDLLPVPTRTFAELGFDDKDRETLAMAVMGYMAVHGEPNVLPSATGASGPVVAGKVGRPARFA